MSTPAEFERRLERFSDGVFAISITLLVLDLCGAGQADLPRLVHW